MEKEKLNRIKEILEEKGVSQTWLARKLDVSKTSVNSLCSNRSQPSLKKLKEISHLLNVSICDLIHDEKERQYKLLTNNKE